LAGEFRHLVDINFLSAMGPPGGGRNPVTARLLRHFNYVAFTEMEDPSKRKIFTIIFKCWMGTSCMSDFSHLFVLLVVAQKKVK
jgi:dynein heavy chain